MAEIFMRILVMSVAGSAVTLLIMALRPITSKFFSPSWQYYIWLSALIAFLIPVSFPTPTAMPKDLPIPSISSAVIQNTDLSDDSAVDTEYPQSPAEPRHIFSRTDIKAILGFIWLFGAAAFFAVKVFKYAAFLRALSKNSSSYSVHLEQLKRLRLRRSSMLDSPLLIGVLKPVLYLPNKELSDEEVSYILLHELTHFKHGDILYKWIMMIALCIHWFNPFAHIASARIGEECEISCDYAATRRLCIHERKTYMRVILSLLSESSTGLKTLTTQMAGSKKIIKRRFTMITNIKKTSKLTAAISVITAAVLTSVTVLASGIISGYEQTDNADISVYRYDEKLEFSNEPFAINNVIYLPVRETLTALGCDDSFITWEQLPVRELEYNPIDSDETVNTVKISVPDEYIKPEAWYDTARPGLTLLRVGINSHTVCGIPMLSINIILKDGVSYVPCTVFEMMKQRYNGIADGFSAEWLSRDTGSIIRIGTDVRPYSEQRTSKLTIDELAVISQNIGNFTSWRLSDLDKYIPDAESPSGLSRRYNISDEYYITVEGTYDSPEIWLWDTNGHGGINLDMVHFDGLPWWN